MDNLPNDYINGEILLIGIFLLLGSCLLFSNKTSPQAPTFRNSLLSSRAFIFILSTVSTGSFVTLVFYYWTTGTSMPNALSGLLPISDSGLYFHCALNLLGAEDPLPGCRMRPLYSFYLASLLSISDLNLQVALILQAFFIGLSATFFVIAIFKTMGIAFALIALATILSFANPQISSLLTENIALTISLPIIALLWVNNARPSALLFSICIFTLLVAQNARPGAMLVILTLLVWVFFCNRKNPKTIVKHALFSFVAITAAILLNDLLANAISNKEHLIHSNFAYIIYGVTAGGKRYLAVIQEHPEIFQNLKGNPTQEINTIYKLAWENFVTHPHLTLLGLMRGTAHYYYELFRFVESVPLRIVFIIFYFAGIVQALIYRQSSRNLLLIAYIVGVSISASIVGFGGGPRIYAATYGFDVLITINGANLITQKIIKNINYQPITWTDNQGSKRFLIVPFIILFASLFIPFAFNQNPKLSKVDYNDCAETEDPIVFRPDIGSPTLALHSTNVTSLLPLKTNITSFKKNIKEWVPQAEYLKNLSENNSLVIIFNLLKGINYGQIKQVQFEKQTFSPGQLIGACLTYKKQPNGDNIAIAVTIKELQE